MTGNRVLAEFDPPKETIGWAKDALEELKTSFQAFFSGEIAEIVIERNSKTGENVQKIKFLKGIPPSFPRKVTEALTNTRHSFDQAIFAAQNVLSIRSNKSIYYPWARDPIDLEHLLSNRRIDQRLWDTIKAHEPYGRADTHTGGDNLIRTLVTIANNKHTVGLRIHGHIAMTRFPAFSGGPVKELRINPPRWDAKKNEAILASWIGECKVSGDYNFGFNIALKDSRLPEPVEVVGALVGFAAKAERVVESLYAKCAEIVGS